jgi:hypothetical protein
VAKPQVRACRFAAWKGGEEDGSSIQARPACLVLFWGDRARLAVSTYERYRIPIEPAPDLAPHPSRFLVRVNRVGLASLLIRELVHYRGDMRLVLSRPCVYGVFSGPVGGFAPRSQKCVGCLRCTVEYPDMVEVRPNPNRLELGDEYFTPDDVDTVIYEASTGRVPVRGAGYRGMFAGDGWDGMWTDMSEIVRPTRDGIHGREFISTAVDLGPRPRALNLDEHGYVHGDEPHVITIQIPMLIDPLPAAIEAPQLYRLLSEACATLQTRAVVPWKMLAPVSSLVPTVIPLVSASDVPAFLSSPSAATMVELLGWDESAFDAFRSARPECIVAVRIPLGTVLDPLLDSGVRVIHLTADYHGMSGKAFALEAIRGTHDRLVRLGLREQVTLIGSGGIIAAEHVAKALICGLDAVALDTPLLIAWQARFDGPCRSAAQARLDLPDTPDSWKAQRLINLLGSWRDQLLEVLGAMGLREVRRLRGEVGRAMLAADLEREAFAGIPGYPEA